jgi:hypothetical protein
MWARPTVSKSNSLPSASNSEAESIFVQARNEWQARAEAPFLSYGIRLRITSGSRRWDNWWEAVYRNSDQRFVARRLVVPGDDEKRLKGTPLCLQMFGLKIFDTNKDAEPIYIEDPSIQAAESFGLLRSKMGEAVNDLDTGESPSTGPTAPPEVGRVQTVARDYAVELVDDEPSVDDNLYHLRLTPLRDPRRLRLRELWVSKDDYLTKKLVVDGISDGEPYDRTRWVASYISLNGRAYLQQIRNEAPLHFGLTTVQDIEFDFVDYRFPQQIQHYLFSQGMSSRHVSHCGP